MKVYDLILKGARLVDPANKVDAVSDLAIKNGKIAAVENNLVLHNAERTIDLDGKTIVPGIIDPHAHFTGEKLGARAYRMMTRAGVVTGVDQGGKMEDVFTSLAANGAGMNIAVNTDIRTYLPSPTEQNPTREDLQRSAEKAVKNGALGIKILGGGESTPPLTPQATQNAIQIANEMRIYVAFHVGTSATSSSLEGLEEAIALAGDNRLHIAHINSYCRGQVKDPVTEALESLNMLQGKQNIISESYISPYNSSTGECVNGVPQNNVTKTCLSLRGYPVSEDGLRKAILDEYCLVQGDLGESDTILLRKEEALRYWSNAKTHARVCFPVNVPEATIPLATRKDSRGEFIVDAICTDGGVAPRNVQVRSGLALVRFGALTLDEFVLKTSYNASRMFGMTHKGHLGPGADADITVLDLAKGEAVMSLALGKTIMIDGIPTGQGGTILTTKKGEAQVKSSGLPYQLIDLEQSRLYQEGP